MPNVDQSLEIPQEESVPPAETPAHTEPDGPHEPWIQEHDPFEDFTAQIDANDERRPPTPEERKEMDTRLEALGDLFAGTTARWHLDGAMNISLLAGDYIGVHKDVDISIDSDDLEALEPILRERGYGFFISKLKDPKDEKSARILQRVGADALRRSSEHATLAAIDAQGKVREDAPLNFVDVHLMRHEPDGRVRGIDELGTPIPAPWCEGIPTKFHERTIQRSHPAKVAYFKLHQTRSYDRTDLEKLAKTEALTTEDVGAVEEVFRQDLERRRAKAEEIFSGVASRIQPGATTGEVLEAFRAEPYLAADVERWERVLPQLQRVAERITAEGGGDPQRIVAIAEDGVGITRAHAEQMRKVAELRQWVTDVGEVQRIRSELQRVEVGRLGDFDAAYFQSLEGPDGWIAIGQENCRNQRYSTVYGSNGERLGIVGVYDTDDDQNISHTVVDPRFRGQGLAMQFKEQIMDALKLPFLTLTISVDNVASLHAAEKLPGVVRVSDAAYEREFQKVKFHFERREAQESFSIAERRQLADVWTRVVLGERVEVSNSDRQTPKEFRQWLHESLMRETAVLANEWGMVPDTELIQRIQAAETPEERAALERTYLERCQELFHQRTSTFRPSSERSTKWDSWPDAMRESGSFNCAGSVLLGMRLLEAAGIRQWIGNPVEHVVNVAQLSDGSWWYVDFLNRNVRQIQPTEEEIAGVRSFAIREEWIEYRHMPILDRTDVAAVVLDNLSTLQHDAHESSADPDDLDVRAARAYVERFPGMLDTMALEPFTVKISGRQHAAMETPVMRAEEERVRALYDLSDDALIRAFRDTIGNRAAQEEFLRAIVPEVDRIHRFLSGEDATCDVADDRARRFAETVAEVIASKAAHGTELHRELVENFIAKLRRASSTS